MIPYFPIEFKETPLGPEDEYYSIKPSELNSLKIYQPENNNKQIRYQIALQNKLMELPSSDLEDFLKYQIKMVQDRLSWLRTLDTMMNKNLQQRTLEKSKHQLILEELIGQLVKRVKSEFNEQQQLFEGNLLNTKLQIEIPVAHFAGLLNILIEEKVIKEFNNKEEFYRTISQIFMTREGKNLDYKYFKNNYLIKQGNHFKEVNKILSKAAKRAEKKYKV
jgi:hypothetical protein